MEQQIANNNHVSNITFLLILISSLFLLPQVYSFNETSTKEVSFSLYPISPPPSSPIYRPPYNISPRPVIGKERFCGIDGNLYEQAYNPSCQGENPPSYCAQINFTPYILEGCSFGCNPDTTSCFLEEYSSKISDLSFKSGKDWIYLSWKNPTDETFSHSLIYLDGVNIANTTEEEYNITNLSPDTNYHIQIFISDNYSRVSEEEESLELKTSKEKDTNKKNPKKSNIEPYEPINYYENIEPRIEASEISISLNSAEEYSSEENKSKIYLIPLILLLLVITLLIILLKIM